MSERVPERTGAIPAGLSPAAAALLRARAPLRTDADGPPVPTSDPLASTPLSFTQERIWLFEQRAPDSRVFTRRITLRLTGALDVPALRRALDALVERHEPLRSVIELTADGAVLRTRPVQAMPLTMDDGDGTPPDERFDLARGPLARAHLRRATATDHELLLVLHHVTSDGWSDGVLLRDLGALYSAYVTGARPSLPPLALRYADFARWQRQRVHSAAGQRALQFWRERLHERPVGPLLPSERARSQEQAVVAGNATLALTPTLTASLRQLARDCNATLPMVILAGYQATVARYASHDDPVIALPVAGRTHPVLEPLVGCFTAVLPVRLGSGSALSFRQLVERARACTLDALAHQDTPAAAALQTLGESPPGWEEALFRVSFNARTFASTAAHFHGLVAERGEQQADAIGSELELELHGTDDDDAVRCVARYDAALFSAAQVHRLLGSLHVLLEAAAAAPDTPVPELPLLTPTERRQLSYDWNQTAVDHPLAGGLHGLVEEQVARTPHTVAVVGDDATLTYQELDRRASAVAADLVALGVAPGGVVAVRMDRSTALVVALYGILKAGGAYLAIDPALPRERQAFMLEDATPVAILTDDAGRSAPIGGTPVVLLDADYWARTAATSSTRGVRSAPEDAAYVIYTSGSTGAPKGVCNTHGGMRNHVYWAQAYFELTHTDVTLQKAPMSFDVAVLETFWPLAAGARLVMARPDGHLDSQYLERMTREHAVTTLHFVPSLLALFLAEARVERCTSLRRVIVGGEALSVELQERFFRQCDARLYNLYGPAEAAVDTTAWECERDTTRRDVPIGRPLHNVQLYVLDERREPVPVGVAGELYIGGAGVAKGYLNRAALTAERFVPDPFRAAPDARLYRTGDVVAWDETGALRFLGRVDGQIKLQGVRIEPGEIEAVLESREDVQQAVVMVSLATPTLEAHLVPTPGHEPSARALREFLRQRLPEHLVPAAFLLHDVIPLSVNGKVDRTALRAATGRPAAADAFIAPRTPVERDVAGIWADVLRVERPIGVHDDFFELGGHSLAAMRVISRVRDAMGTDVGVRALFTHPDLASFSAAIVAAHSSDGDDLAGLLDDIEDLSEEDASRLMETLRGR